MSTQSTPLLGASPDGWVNCECCGGGVVEIECPYNYRFTHPDCISDSNFYLQRFSDQLKLDPRHKYYYQVQMQLSICEVNCCDFVVWTLAGMVTIRVYRNEAFFHQIQPSLWSFFEKHILPELLTRNLQHPVTVVTTTTTGPKTEAVGGSSDVYCYCQQPEDERRMIGCDSEKCK